MTLRAIIVADPLRTTREVAKELNINHTTVIRHLKQIGKVKKLCKWVPHELTENQKNCHFEVSSSLHSTQQQTISWSDCDMQWKVDFIWQVAMTSSVAGLRSSKALPKAKHASEKGPGHCLIVCCLPDPLQLSESHWNHYIWEVCSVNWWDAQKLQSLQPALVNRRGPILLHDNVWPHIAQPMLQNLNELG